MKCNGSFHYVCFLLSSRSPGRWKLISEISETKNHQINFRSYKPLQHRPDNFFHRVLVLTLKHKKSWIKKIIPPWRSIHSNAPALVKTWKKLFQKFRLTRDFHWKSKTLIFQQNYGFSMETRSKSEILEEFCIFFD